MKIKMKILQRAMANEARKSITKFFDHVHDLLQNNFVKDERRVNLFKTICVYDYMHARCDWDSDVCPNLVQDMNYDGKEHFARNLTNYILDKEYDGFYCEECDDYCKYDDCEHEKYDQCDLLEKVMSYCEKIRDREYDFQFPDLQGQYFIDRTKRLFDNRDMNYGFFLDQIYSEYNEHLESMCC